MSIALTYTGNPEKHQYYVDWLKGSEDIDIVTLSFNKRNLQELDRCQALVLSGGIDIHPRFYRNGAAEYPGAPVHFDPERDSFELEAFHRSIDRKIPVLGICRGMQLINIGQGGTLHQDLPAGIASVDHRGNPDKTHPVKIIKDTLLGLIGGLQAGVVNTAHHQGIETPGQGLRVNSFAPDGLAEGIEWEEGKARGFLLGVQWHPERMFKFHLENTPLSASIRKRLLEEISMTHT